jgi:hypothetical protein
MILFLKFGDELDRWIVKNLNSLALKVGLVIFGSAGGFGGLTPVQSGAVG